MLEHSAPFYSFGLPLKQPCARARTQVPAKKYDTSVVGTVCAYNKYCKKTCRLDQYMSLAIPRLTAAVVIDRKEREVCETVVSYIIVYTSSA